MSGRMRLFSGKFRYLDEGQTLTDYCLVLFFVAFGLITLLGTFGQNLVSMYGTFVAAF
jgi:Flp pilus assembly pilin Flp